MFFDMKKIWGDFGRIIEPIPRAKERNDVGDADRPSPVAIIYRSELDILSRFILDYPRIETGGQLFGYWTATGSPVVCYTIGPGREAQHNSTSFVQDWNYLETIGKAIYERYRLQHIGEWHSHHQLGLAYPSNGDVNTMKHGVGKPGFPRLLLCIGNCIKGEKTIVNAFNFHENNPKEYVHAVWDVVDLDSPFRQIVDKELQRFIVQPTTKQASHEQIYSIRNVVCPSNNASVHWLTENAQNVETMKTFVTMVQTLNPEFDVKTEILESGEPLIVIRGTGVCIKFPYGFPSKSPVLLKETEEIDKVHVESLWKIGEEPLMSSFRRWLEMIQNEILRLTECESSIIDESLLFPSEGSPKSSEDKKNFFEAQARADRLVNVNQVLEANFRDDFFAWSGMTDNPVINIVAFPLRKNLQGVIRMTLHSNYPNVPPDIQYGFLGKDLLTEGKPLDHLAEISYSDLSSLFDNADEVFCRLLKWENDTSFLKAYIIACLMLYYYNEAKHNHKNVMDYIEPFLEDDEIIQSLSKKVIAKIKQFKH